MFWIREAQVNNIYFKTTIISLLIIVSQAIAVDNCIECHNQIHEQIISDCKEDAHSRARVFCAGCHGGNSALADEEAMNPKYGFVGAPKPKDIPRFCARCHSDAGYMRNFNPALPVDQLEKYWTSRHGELFKKGDYKVAVCNSCHKAHGVFPSGDTRSSAHPKKVPSTCAKCHSDPALMQTYGIPTHQYTQYIDSSNVHGYALFVKNDITAPVCNDCHGNHGAAPPGVSQVGQVCSHCHMLNAKLFRASPHKDGFDALGTMECAFCHQASPDVNAPLARIHTIVKPMAKLAGTVQPAVCVQCHSQGDAGWQMAGKVSAGSDSLAGKFAAAEALIKRAEKRGLEVSDARWQLNGDIHRAMLELRTAIHSFDLEAWQQHFDYADSLVNAVNAQGLYATQELSSRYKYFLIMTLIIALLIVLLILKIHQVENDRKAALTNKQGGIRR